jgi:uncharacterized membrane protein YwzB
VVLFTTKTQGLVKVVRHLVKIVILWRSVNLVFTRRVIYKEQSVSINVDRVILKTRKKKNV